MSSGKPYRSLFVGTLRQDSFLSVGGTTDPFTTVDSPFCCDGRGRPTLRGSGLAGALVATLRRLNGAVPDHVSGGENGRQPSAWRFFNSHPAVQDAGALAARQHVAIHPQTGTALEGALFNVETLPPRTEWAFLLEVDSSQAANAADLAEAALAHWAAGRCLLGREVARGMGWMTLTDLRRHDLGMEAVDLWPNAEKADHYRAYIKEKFGSGRAVEPASGELPGWVEIRGQLQAGPDQDGYGLDSLSIGGHASEELTAAWDQRYLGPAEIGKDFGPDTAIVTWPHGNSRIPFIPGSSLRGPLRHALHRHRPELVDSLFGTTAESAKLLICDAFPLDPMQTTLAWFQMHAEDEFSGGAFGSAKFDRVAVVEGSFEVRIVIENTTAAELAAVHDLLRLAEQRQLGFGGGKWRGHGWLRWTGSETGTPNVMEHADAEQQ